MANYFCIQRIQDTFYITKGFLGNIEQYIPEHKRLAFGDRLNDHQLLTNWTELKHFKKISINANVGKTFTFYHISEYLLKGRAKKKKKIKNKWIFKFKLCKH